MSFFHPDLHLTNPKATSTQFLYPFFLFCAYVIFSWVYHLFTNGLHSLRGSIDFLLLSPSASASLDSFLVHPCFPYLLSFIVCSNLLHIYLFNEIHYFEKDFWGLKSFSGDLT